VIRIEKFLQNSLHYYVVEENIPDHAETLMDKI
jgi:hypothetical protein